MEVIWEKVKTFADLPIVSAVLVFFVCWIAITVILKIVDKLMARGKADAALKGFLRKCINAALWVLAIIVVADKLGIHTASFVALLSVVGLALSLSVQGLMTNLFSGVTILGTRPFTAGDYVEIDTVAGTVTAVGLFYTQIATIDNKYVFIPNGQVASKNIVNYTTPSIRRVDMKFNAGYGDTTEAVKAALLDAVGADSRILDTPAPVFVGLNSFRDSSVEYVVRAWVKTQDYWDVYFALNEKVREIFLERGISMSYAHMNVHLMESREK